MFYKLLEEEVLQVPQVLQGALIHLVPLVQPVLLVAQVVQEFRVQVESQVLQVLLVQVLQQVNLEVQVVQVLKVYQHLQVRLVFQVQVV